jgi:hypothetical protein
VVGLLIWLEKVGHKVVGYPLNWPKPINGCFYKFIRMLKSDASLKIPFNVALCSLGEVIAGIKRTDLNGCC